MKPELLDDVVMGAMFDFGGYLTTRAERMTVSATDSATPMADAIKAFLIMRGVDQSVEPRISDWSSRCSMLTQGVQPSPCAQALAVLSAAMRDDPGYAWSWHCNIAMAAVDEGAPHDAGNAAAARFMLLCFGVDTTKPPTAPSVDEGCIGAG